MDRWIITGYLTPSQPRSLYQVDISQWIFLLLYIIYIKEEKSIYIYIYTHKNGRNNQTSIFNLCPNFRPMVFLRGCFTCSDILLKTSHIYNIIAWTKITTIYIIYLYFFFLVFFLPSSFILHCPFPGRIHFLSADNSTPWIEDWRRRWYSADLDNPSLSYLWRVILIFFDWFWGWSMCWVFACVVHQIGLHLERTVTSRKRRTTTKTRTRISDKNKNKKSIDWLIDCHKSS